MEYRFHIELSEPGCQMSITLGVEIKTEIGVVFPVFYNQQRAVALGSCGNNSEICPEVYLLQS